MNKQLILARQVASQVDAMLSGIVKEVQNVGRQIVMTDDSSDKDLILQTFIESVEYMSVTRNCRYRSQKRGTRRFSLKVKKREIDELFDMNVDTDAKSAFRIVVHMNRDTKQEGDPVLIGTLMVPVVVENYDEKIVGVKTGYRAYA